MIKRDLSGLLQIYGVAGFYILIWTLGLFKVIFGIREFWAQNSFFFKLVAISSLLFLLVALVVSFYLLVHYHKNWLRMERARSKPEVFPLYEPQPSYAPALQGGGIPPTLKKTLAHRDIIQIVLTLLVVLDVLVVIFTLVAIASNTHMTAQIVFAPWEESRLFAVGGKADRQPEWIELSSAKVLLRWPFTLKDFGILGGPRYRFLARDMPESPYRSITRGEYEYQLRRLYGYVCLKTNLPLRDLRL